jgi:hypothetical protein
MSESRHFKPGHYLSAGQTVTYRSTNSTLPNSEYLSSKSPEIPARMNVRYKLTNYMIEDGGTASELKKEENRKKEMQSIRARLNKINEIENYRKEQFKKN